MLYIAAFAWGFVGGVFAVVLERALRRERVFVPPLGIMRAIDPPKEKTPWNR